MSRWIDADALLINQREGLAGEEEIWTVEDIVSAPSIDIVRCSECKYYEAKEDWCYWRDEAITADDFCSYGERETSDE